MCRVNVTTTLDEHSIYVEKYDDPKSLEYAVEGEDPGPVARIAWRGYIRKHPTHSLNLQLQPSLPHWRLHQVERAALWLVRQIFRERAA